VSALGPVRRWARRRFWPSYRRAMTAYHPLRYLFLEITQRCNLACLHCGSDCRSDPNLEELSTEEWVGVLDYVAPSPTARMPVPPKNSIRPRMEGL